ncbi:RNA polymerase sigma-70 factor [Compostibacter hankyongensis]|uniref:RNA polymerase sigma-70 factor n=1 Tax=Compostibacter hankyongensis TaxID=1007089 RepID=A0ABP8G1K3_9BACT
MSSLREGNVQAFEMLYNRYYAALCRKTYKRIPSVPRAEEIVQDVFVNLWVKAASLYAGGNVRAYLYATLQNKILHELRTAYTRSRYLKDIRDLARQEGELSASGHAEALSLSALYVKEAEMQISHAVAALSPQCREAFRLSRDEQLSYKEIAERMHISVNTVEKHVGKALRILRLRLKEYGDVMLLLCILSLYCP